MKKRAGFTLIEVIITVIVLGIIVGVAIPRYTAHFEKMRGAEARSICYQAYSGYYRLVAEAEVMNPSNPVNWARLGMTDPNLNPNRYFNYSLQGGPGLTFIRADRLGTNGTQWLRVRTSDGALTKTAPY